MKECENRAWPVHLVVKFVRTSYIYVPSNRVTSSPFSHRTFFFTKFHEGTLYFFSGSKFIKKDVGMVIFGLG
jgi:hypothetical protein